MKSRISVGIFICLSSYLLLPTVVIAQDTNQYVDNEGKTVTSNHSGVFGEKISNLQDKATETIDDWMPDKALQTAIAKILRISVQNITKDSMLNLPRELNLSSVGITNITGLEYAKNINRVELDDNVGIDESSLQNTFSKMTNLTKISVRNCQIKTLDWASGLTWLTYLDVSSYRGKGLITSLESIRNLIQLDFLNIKNNQITDLSPLQNMEKLEIFWGGQNPYSDVSPLKNAKLSTFDVETTNVEDISILKGKGGSGYFKEAKIADLSPASNYTIWSAENQRVTMPEVYVLNQAPYKISVLSPIQGNRDSLSGDRMILVPKNVVPWTGSFDFSTSKMEWSGGNSIPDTGNLVSTWSVTRNNKRGISFTFSGTYDQPYSLSKATITVHNSTVYVGDNWNPIDNFDSALDHQGNPLDFSKIQVHGTVNTSEPGVYPVVYSYEGLEKKVEVIVEGKVDFSVPDNISFGVHKLSRGTNYYSSENLQKQLIIIDTRGKGNSWQLSARLQSELTNTNGKVIPNALIYKENQIEKTITTSSQVIAHKTTTEKIDTTDVSANWSNNEGLLLKINAENAFPGEYTTIIEWTLNDIP